jgi:hypothetical protein
MKKINQFGGKMGVILDIIISTKDQIGQLKGWFGIIFAKLRLKGN